MRVVVVDDEPLTRAGVRYALEQADDLDVAAAVPVAGAVETIQEQLPQVVLLDSCTSDAEPLSDGIGRLDRPPSVCVFSRSSDRRHVAVALAAGASGYVLKSTPSERLAPLVRSLADGWTMLSAGIGDDLATRYVAGLGRDVSAGHLSRLTARERQILVLVGAGLSNAEIGLRTHLSPATVKDHVGSILRKLEVSSRLRAALLADRAGLLPY
ncbi:DNA-binding response regulator [Streptomyces sp. WAC 01529]|nr:DNA-binding response regulator [Streptomyces sp. WAC 01529]